MSDITALYGAVVILSLLCLTLAWGYDRHTKQIKTLKFVLGQACVDLAFLKEKQGMRDGEVVAAITGNIDAELEKSAELTEMRRAKRRTIPRENAGPPARVSKLRLHRK